LSISGKRPFNLRRFSGGGRSVLETLGSRRVSVNELGPVCFGTESLISRYASSDNQK
jgi:hypothetical protein